MSDEETDEEIEEDEEESQEEVKIEIPRQIYELEMSKIKLNPREYVCNWMEGNLLHVGRRVFKMVCLLPCSFIIPSIPFGSTGIRTNINAFLIGSPASGKSSIIKKFLGFSYFPIRLKGISARKFMDKIYNYDGVFSLGVDDISNVFNQPDGYETIKIMEGALGDEKEASHENMKYTKKIKSQATALIGGTWTDLRKFSSYMQGGFLSRMSLMFLSINRKQREEIADFINRGVGNMDKAQESRIKEVIVKDYYKLLFDIQADPKKQIKGYYFDESFKGMALATWKKLTKDYSNDINGDFKREFHDFYRFFVCHAFLNIFNRKVKDGILYPIREDYEFALSLMEETLSNKIVLIKSKMFIHDLDSPVKLLKFLNNPLKEDIRNIILNLSPYGNMVASNSMKVDKELKK